MNFIRRLYFDPRLHRVRRAIEHGLTLLRVAWQVCLALLFPSNSKG
jgi:hypothetical protein